MPGTPPPRQRSAECGRDLAMISRQIASGAKPIYGCRRWPRAGLLAAQGSDQNAIVILMHHNLGTREQRLAVQHPEAPFECVRDGYA